MTSAIVSALDILTKPVGEASVRNAQSSQQEALLAALRTKRSLLLEQLGSERCLEEARRLRDETLARAGWFCGGGGGGGQDHDVTWAFVQECLLLLLTLARHLASELEAFKRAAPPPADRRTPEAAPPLPPDVLSVGQQKTVGAALQFVVSLGLCPYLAPGVGVPLARRSAFGAMVEKLPRGGDGGSSASRRLLTTTNVLLDFAEAASLATLLFTRHLGDVMAALCQLGHRPHRAEACGDADPDAKELNAEERWACRQALRGLLVKVYQPVVIKELLVLQGRSKQPGSAGGNNSRAAGAGAGSAPAWLRRLCGQLLSERLMQPHGVQAVVRAVLEAGPGGECDWAKCDAVARILAACPQQSASPESYYQQVCPQILDLLHFKDKLTAQQFQRVATRAALSMVQEKPDFAQQHLLAPLLAPLHRCQSPSGDVEEWELTRCLDDVFKIWVVGNSPSAPLLKALEEVLPVIFTLFCFTKRNASHLRAPCQQILHWYLSVAEAEAAMLALRLLAGLREHQHHRVAAHIRFGPGSHGGARLCRSHRSSEEEEVEVEEEEEEEEALYEKVSAEQWRLECVTQLLSELGDSQLPGDFFLQLLQELTSWAAAEEGRQDEDEEEELDVAAMTLLELERRQLGRAERCGRRLALLQLLAILVETLPHSALLTRNLQVVGFIASLLRRACVGLDQDSGNPVESQSLSMAIGLVATLLSGPQLTAEVYASMADLLPPLETLSQKHPEVFIQELASNLRAVIATHGAYTPQDLAAAAAAAAAATTARRSGDSTSKSPTLEKKAPSRGRPPHANHPGGDGRSSAPPQAPTAPAKAFSDWLLEACDPDVPNKAWALRALTRAVQSRDPEAQRAQDKVLTLFLENLEHEDSFVYLSAIQGLAALAERHPEQILERLLRDFQLGPSLPTSQRQRSLECRLKMGEVLMRASRAMGELAPHLGGPLVVAFLRGARDPDHSLRASSLSNLGEICQRMDYALGPLAQELSSCLTALIKTEKEAEVRRAAVHVITQLLRGLSDKSTQVLAPVLLDLYRALRWAARSDPDGAARLHAQLALDELDAIMRRYAFPQPKLEKKIVVLP